MNRTDQTAVHQADVPQVDVPQVDVGQGDVGQGGSSTPSIPITSKNNVTTNHTPETVFDPSHPSDMANTAPTQIQPTPSTVVLATGGTGGHIYPAIAVAKALQAAGHDVLVIGQKHGLEAQLVAAAGVTFVGVSAGKFDRQRPNPLAVFKVIWGVMEAVWQVARARPSWVIGFGGFASFPALAAAWLLRRPIALHEANAYPGLVTKVMARVARVVAAAEPTVQTRLPDVHVVAVGLPIRTEQISQEDARCQLGLPQDALVTLVMGGSQGAKILNDYVPKAYAQLANTQLANTQLANAGEHVVLHSAGKGREAEVRSTANTYRVVPYVDAALAWSAADVAITRAGSSTLAEAAFYGVPLIMVPFAAAAEQHQLHNARAVEASGAGIVIEEQHLRASVDPLIDAWQRLAEAEYRQQASQAARARAYPQAAERLLLALGLSADDSNTTFGNNDHPTNVSYPQDDEPQDDAPHAHGTTNTTANTAANITANTSTQETP
jgi:UDP-N-acetylglucosamine--N-acetylmuramyl-(pentapeptide) pyrophosphoryl-undecaprenol N-acetylglucosamine transferase